ncbi:MAG: ClbS/DfsB family four-helix bundle protein [Chloroflexota bacterium]
MPNQDAILSLKHAYQDFTELILSLSDEQFLSPMNGWAPRDVVAHLVGWNGLMIESSLSILAGKPPAYYEDARNDYSNINAGFTAKHSSRSKRELLAELKSSMEKFEAFIHALPAEELTADHGVVHYSGSPATVGRIINSLAGDYQYHTRQIKEWLKQPN